MEAFLAFWSLHRPKNADPRARESRKKSPETILQIRAHGHARHYPPGWRARSHNERRAGPTSP